MSELTPEEKANGWTEETLKAYFSEREREASKRIYGPRNSQPRAQNSKYSPHRWRR